MKRKMAEGEGCDEGRDGGHGDRDVTNIPGKRRAGADIKPESNPLSEPALEAQHLPKPTQLPRQHTPFAENCSTYKSVVESWLESTSPLAEDEETMFAGYEDAWEEDDKMSSASKARRLATAVSTAPSKAETSTTLQQGVESADYRNEVLARNNIRHCLPEEPLPDFLSELVQHVRQRTSVPLFPQAALLADPTFRRLETFVLESSVGTFLLANIFKTEKSDSVSLNALQCVARAPLEMEFVPNETPGEISHPVPDGLFGYFEWAFPEHVSILQASVNAERLLFPFLLFEAQGGHGPMLAAVNQCLGGAATVVNLAERLHAKLLGCRVEGLPPANRAIFSVTANGYHGSILIFWKTGATYLTHWVDSFNLIKPAEFIDFHRQVQNIFEWARTERLDAFRVALKRLEDAGCFAQRVSAKSPVPTESLVSAPSLLSNVQNASDEVWTAKKRKIGPS